MNARLRRWHGEHVEDQRATRWDSEEWHAWCRAFALSGRLLDVGCGLHPYPEAVGVDWVARSTVRADAQQLPIRTRSIDAVISSHLIEHVDPIAMLREVSRVVRPGGLLLLQAPNLMGVSRALRVRKAGVREAFYPTGARTLHGALVRGIVGMRHVGRIVHREPELVPGYGGKDPDATWWCNGVAVLRVLGALGWSVEAAEGIAFGHTFRIAARAA